MAELSQEAKIIERYNRIRHAAMDGCADAWRRAQEDFRFAKGGEGQWNKDDLKALHDNAKPTLSISKIPNILRTLSGKQIMDRFERQYLPRHRQHRAYAEAMTKVDRAFMERGEAKIAESAAFLSAATTGHGWTRMYFDTLEDPRGKIMIEECPLFSMLWPDSCRKHNLTDRAWQSYGEYWRLEEVMETFNKREIPALPSWYGDGQKAESTPGYVPVTGGGSQAHPGEIITWVEHFEWWEAERKILLAVPTNPNLPWEDPQQQFERVELFDEDVDPYLAQLQQTGIELPEIAKQEVRRKVYRYAKVVGDVLLETDIIPVQRFTFENITGHRVFTDADMAWRFEGIVELLKDRQRMENMFWSTLVDQWRHSPKGTLIFEKGAFLNRADALRQWAHPSGVIEMEQGSLRSGNPPYTVESGQRNAAMEQAEKLMAIVGSSVVEGAGLNPAALGNLGPDLRRISGQVVRSLQDAALASNAQLFDNLGLFRRRQGTLFLSFLSHYYSEEDVAELAGTELLADPEGNVRIPPKEMWREDAWRSISVQEAVPSPDATRATWEGLVQSGALQALLTSGAISPRVVVELVPDIPESVRDMARQDIQSQLEQQQAMMRQQQQAGAEPPA